MWFLAYLIGCFTTCLVAAKQFKHQDNDPGVIAFVSVFWPIVVPSILIALGINKIIDKLNSKKENEEQ
jgi:hypothetical protein